MATPEKKVKQKIRTILDSYGASYNMPATHGYGASGTHDFIICYRSLFLTIEAKGTYKDVPTGLQKLYAREVHGSGGSSLLIHAGNLEDVRELMERINNGTHIPGANLWPVKFMWDS